MMRNNKAFAIVSLSILSAVSLLICPYAVRADKYGNQAGRGSSLAAGGRYSMGDMVMELKLSDFPDCYEFTLSGSLNGEDLDIEDGEIYMYDDREGEFYAGVFNEEDRKELNGRVSVEGGSIVLFCAETDYPEVPALSSLEFTRK